MDGAPACPFVAFGDDREGRSTSPDHRHRCFAESPPAPRAVAHQEAYCLSSAFPVCPTFQDWARREAAHARGAGRATRETAPSGRRGRRAVSAASRQVRRPSASVEPTGDSRSRRPARPTEPPVVARPAARLGGAAAVGHEAGAGRAAPAPRRRARTSARGRPHRARARVSPGAPRIDWPARSPPPRPTPIRARPPWLPQPAAGAPSAAPPRRRAGRRSVRASGPRARADRPSRPSAPRPPSTGTGTPPAVSSTRPTGDPIAGPPWERMRRYEAYPTIKTRAGLPGMPRPVARGAGRGGARDRGSRPVHAAGPARGRGRWRTGESGPERQQARRDGQARRRPSRPAPTPQVYVDQGGRHPVARSRRSSGSPSTSCWPPTRSIKNPNKISTRPGDRRSRSAAERRRRRRQLCRALVGRGGVAPADRRAPHAGRRRASGARC